MDITRYFSVRRNDEHDHGRSHESDFGKSGKRKYLPFLANPINKDIREVLSNGSFDLERPNAATSTADGSDATTTFAGNGRTSRGNIIIYKQHHEAHTIELFYDLFFVANLGTLAFWSRSVFVLLTSPSLLHCYAPAHRCRV
jgi:hypothetical protein